MIENPAFAGIKPECLCKAVPEHAVCFTYANGGSLITPFVKLRGRVVLLKMVIFFVFIFCFYIFNTECEGFE